MLSAIEKFEKMTFNKEEIRNHAELFDESIFKKKISNYMNECYEEFKSTKHWEVSRGE